jgi:hypothetical protein
MAMSPKALFAAAKAVLVTPYWVRLEKEGMDPVYVNATLFNTWVFSLKNQYALS